MNPEAKEFREAQMGQPVVERNQGFPPTGNCLRCGSEWTLVNDQWLWTERSGATHLLKEYRALDERGQPPPLTRCPCCRADLRPVGKARVEEVEG